MSWTDTILSNTVGVAFRAATGNVDPWTLQQQKDDIAAATKQALGPDADPDLVAQKTAAALHIGLFLAFVESSQLSSEAVSLLTT